ncbi:MAG: hypothetical protein PHF73_12440 [Massilibacteroides sp.]|nr:hypothetical protein [Massilibacteroides sp.]
MKIKSIILYTSLFLYAIDIVSQVKSDDTLSSWSKGCLDIHIINTGKGECSFLILPDGTTMLVDAGALIGTNPRVTAPKPDGTKTPGEWITRYILHTLQHQAKPTINYVLLTHFHDDHMGEISPELKKSKAGYYLSGITEVCENIPFDKLIDRGWPEYNWPQPIQEEYVKNYILFAKKNAQKGIQVEQFKAGENNQFTLIHQPEKYPEFEIRNIAVNGVVWTGVNNTVRNHFPAIKDLSDKEYPSENMCSTAFRLSYGKFDYFNGGDITCSDTGTWRDIETPIGYVTGPVEICIANHHAYYDAMGVPFLQSVRPQVFIIQIWSAGQPSTKVLTGMLSQNVYPGKRDIFSTNLMEETKIVVGTRLNQLKSAQGHIIIRVAPGGEQFMIYILDDSKENYKVKAIHGPYICN